MADTVNICKWPKVILHGDSLTQQSFSPEGCWGSLLADHLIRRCDVINRGFSGYNNRFCKVMLPYLMDRQTASETVALTIFLGANDSNPLTLSPGQHVPLEEYRQNLTEMVEFSMSLGLRRDQIILITPPAVYGPDFLDFCMEKSETYSFSPKEREDLEQSINKVRGTYVRACLEVAEETGTRKVDIYSEMVKTGDFQKYLRDGLHFSVEGSRMLFNLLRPHIDELTAHLPEMLFPRFNLIQQDDLKGSLSKF